MESIVVFDKAVHWAPTFDIHSKSRTVACELIINIYINNVILIIIIKFNHNVYLYNYE